jgi:mannose-6-phosphate isomerase-like protein (cupin superfamily)
MKRNRFIAAMMAMVTAPFLGSSQSNKSGVQNDKPFKIKAGEGRIHGHIKLKGVNSNILDVKISGSDTNDGLAIFEQTSLSRGRGTPLHLHHAQDEVFYVLEGAYQFKCGEEKFDLAAGDSIFLPRKVPHAWIQVSETGKMIVVLQPAGKLENFFITMATLDHEPTAKEVETIFSNNGMQVVGPPLKVN